ncbi:hypothetical protein [Paraburkholderia sp. RL17-337-BIB-A]|uniref:hypothetical protein n=1 Tax=Paraburkholderia sp. RL17-337-BIB-A TaxID=3031636 RepID=UPI0038B83CD0
MTKTQADALKLRPPRKTSTENSHPEIEESSNRARLAFSVETLWKLKREDVVSVQSILQHGRHFGLWETPAEWLAPGSSKNHVDLRDRIWNFLPVPLRIRPDGLMDSLLDYGALVATRYLTLLRMGPSGKGRDGYRALGPSTVKSIAYSYVTHIISLAVAKHYRKIINLNGSIAPDLVSPSSKILSRLTRDDLANLTSGAVKGIMKEWYRMAMLAAMGYWDDVPKFEEKSRAKAIAGAKKENPRPTPRDPHLPLPDEYVAQMGANALWLTLDLGPNLLSICELIGPEWRNAARVGIGPATVGKERSRFVRAFLRNFEWRDRDGRIIETPPFVLRLPTRKGFGAKNDVSDKGLRWPPKNFQDLTGLFGCLQNAHMFVALLSLAPRRSEILGLERSCVQYAIDGHAYANGLTYKLVELHEGEYRDWLLPEVARIAIEQQARLIALLEYLGPLKPGKTTKKGNESGSYLWGQISSAGSNDAGAALKYTSKMLKSFARVMDMDLEPEGQSIRAHRFRKTLARLVALALTQAPRLLMEIFGHATIDATLHYILTDKGIRAEIEKVTRELRVMLATDVVEAMLAADLAGSDDLGGFGGPAAEAIHKTIEIQREKRHRRGEDLGAESATELGELLTLQGKAWEMVRPGVICTKFPGESGPCNRNRGYPEPSKCQSKCAHRLEQRFLHDDVDGAIEQCVASYEDAVRDEESLIASHWAAQIRSHVVRFKDLYKKWLLHPTVKSLMSLDSGKEAHV